MTSHNLGAVVCAVVRRGAVMTCEVHDVGVPVGEREISDFLHKCVHGLFDVVHVGDGIDMWVNDEGLINGSPLNPAATSVKWQEWMRRPDTILMTDDPPICGDVVFVGSDENGETVPLTDDQWHWLHERLG